MLSPRPSHLQGGERGCRLTHSSMINDLIEHAFVMKPPRKPKGRGSESFLVGARGNLGKVMHTEVGAPPQTLALYVFSTWLFLSCVLL